MYFLLLNFFPQRFPDDGLGTVVRNVFDFDGYSKEVWISNAIVVRMINIDPLFPLPGSRHSHRSAAQAW